MFRQNKVFEFNQYYRRHATLTGAQIDVIIDGIGTLSNTYE